MKNENAVKFKEILLTDKSAQERLKELAAAYTGDKKDSEAFMTATVGKLAEELNLPFTYEEGVEVFTNTDDEQLSESEIQAVAGGGKGGVCIIIGGYDGVDADLSDGLVEGHACAYVGVGF